MCSPGCAARNFSEPDLILHAPQIGMVFVEVKYASANSTRFDQGKAQRYFEGGRDFLKEDYAGMKHYELLCNWVIGYLLAKNRHSPSGLSIWCDEVGKTT